MAKRFHDGQIKFKQQIPIMEDAIATQNYYEGANGDQGSGHRMRTLKRKYAGPYKFKVTKALSAALMRVEMVLQAVTSQKGPVKHLVSEFDPTRGGFVSIPKKTASATPVPGNAVSEGDWARLPMHCFDLNFVPGLTLQDTTTNFPPVATNMNNNINARHWIMAPDQGTNLKWSGVMENNSARWIADNPEKTIANYTQPKIYRNYIDLKFMLYGCTKTNTKYDIRVIRITDPRFCPDFPNDLQFQNPGTPDFQEVQYGWQNLLTPYTVNPLLTGEPGPRKIRRWFNTVCRKTVHIGEQTGEIETIPCVQMSMRVNINKTFDYAWSAKDFQGEPASFKNDSVLEPNDKDGNNRFMHKPYYTSRYYLLIRALCPTDTATTEANNEDDAATDTNELRASRVYDDNGHTGTICRYIPTFDMVVRNVYTIQSI